MGGLVESLELHGRFQLKPSVRARVLTMSSATIDRLVAPFRQSSGGMDGGTLHGPITACGYACRCARLRARDRKQPGWLAGDRPGDQSWGPPGRAVYLDSGANRHRNRLSENLLVITRDDAPLLAAIQPLRQQLPFPLPVIDANNDPTFMNALMEHWCDAPKQGIELNPSRAYQRNDQA